MNMNEPLLSVCLITYNHVNYVSQAIEGVLMQQVNFNWELVIADDFSRDGTREIILKYKEKYPDFIKLIFQDKNVGPAKNWSDLLHYPNSKYIAYFEGDDYWTDPYKLQKQIDFLEKNDDYSLSCHNSWVIYENKTKESTLFTNFNTKSSLSMNDILSSWRIPTASLMFRRSLVDSIPSWVIYHGDYFISLWCAHHGKVHYSNSVMSVYRKNDESIFEVMRKKDPRIIKENIVNMLTLFDEFTEYKYSTRISVRKDYLIKLYDDSYLKRKNIYLYFLLRPRQLFLRLSSMFCSKSL